MPCAHKKCIHGRDKRYCKLGCKNLVLPRKPRSSLSNPSSKNLKLPILPARKVSIINGKAFHGMDERKSKTKALDPMKFCELKSTDAYEVVDEISQYLVLEVQNQLSQSKACARKILNLCTQNPPLDFQILKAVIPVVSTLIRHHDNKVVSEACLSIHAILRAHSESHRFLSCNDILSRVIVLLGCPDSQILDISLKILDVVSSGIDSNVQVLLDNGALKPLSTLLSHETRCIRRRTARILSNMAVGPGDYAKAFVDSGVMSLLLKMLETEQASTHELRVKFLTKVLQHSKARCVAHLSQIADMPRGQECQEIFARAASKECGRTADLLMESQQTIFKHREVCAACH